MLRRASSAFCLLSSVFCLLCEAQIPIGAWREHLPYGSAIKVLNDGKKIWCATPYSLFSYDPANGEIIKKSKVNALSEVGISTIAWDSINQKLIVGYSNSNIDIISSNKVSNIPDIKRKSIQGDKNIYSIDLIDGKCWVSTGFGIVVIDQLRNETSDTYIIGSNGNNVRVNGISYTGTDIYAATSEGLKRAQKNQDFSDYRNWNTIRTGNIKQILAFQNRSIISQNDSLFILNGAVPGFFYGDGWTITNISVSGDRLLVSQNKPGADGRVRVMRIDGSTEKIISFPSVLKLPQQATQLKEEYWIADLFGGLEKVNASGIEKIIPNSPFELSTGNLAFFNNSILVPAGSVDAAWNYQYLPFGLFSFSGEKWSSYNKYNYPVLDSVADILTVTGDRRNGDIWFGSFGGGLAKLSNNAITVYKQNVISQAVGDPGSYRVGGLAFDEANNLWISNYGAAVPLLVRKADGTLKLFPTPFTLFQNATAQIKISPLGNKWIVSPKGNGLIFLNSGNIDNPGDDTWRLYKQGAGNGNLPHNQVYCVEVDHYGFAWVGTEKGIAIIPCEDQPNCEAYLPVVKDGTTTGYLLQDENVLSIATDGANRKWVGTAKGLWLISADGEKVLEHYTEDNSPLLGNIVRSIVIDPRSGEIFIETNKGLCSYRGWANEFDGSGSTVTVFPNPVTKNYSGLIGIRGLENDSRVQITELNGRILFETRSLGGQAVWNGRDRSGRRPASGTYLVLSNNKLVGKIIFIQ